MTALLAKARVAAVIPATILKSAGLSPLAEIVVYEVAYAEALLAAHRAVAVEAIREAVAVLEQRRERPIDSNLVDEAVAAVTATYERRFEDKIRPVVKRLDRAIYEASKDVAWRRAMGAIKTPLVYDFKKVDDPPWRTLPVQRTTRDEDAIAESTRHHVFWIGSFFGRVLAREIGASVQEALSGSPTGSEAAHLARAALRRDLGLTDEKPQAHWPSGTPANYFTMTSAAATTTLRAAGTLQALLDAGVRYGVWRTANDERVCPRCSAMDGRRIPLDRAVEQLQAKWAARTRADLQSSAPWHSEAEFLALVEQADASGESEQVLADNGVVLPPVHAACRCTLDVDNGTSPTFGPDTDAVHSRLREMVAERAIGALSQLTSSQRHTVFSTIGGLAAWLNVIAVTVLVSEILDVGLSRDVTEQVDAVAVGSTLHVTSNALDEASVGQYNGLAFALASLAIVDPSAVHAAFENAKAKGLLLHPSAIDAPVYFAQGFEAYLEQASSDDRPDRKRLALFDPPLHALIDSIVQDRVILGTAEVLGLTALTSPRERRQLSDVEKEAVQVLRDASNTASATDYLALQPRLLSALLALDEDERRHYANAFAFIGARKGWLE